MFRFYRHFALIVLGACAGIGVPNLAYAQTPKILEVRVQLGTIRADLRFREDGVHTIVTIRREK